MEYLASSISAYFKDEAHRIGKLSGKIKDREPKKVGLRISSKLDEKLIELPELISLDNEGWSVRDVITHKFPVGAGELHIFYEPDGYITVSFIGGGSKIFPWEPDRKKEIINGNGGQRIGILLLTPTLQALLSTLETLIFDLYGEIGFRC